jgi:DtxR family Mn-dependent transcriptional regulator
MTMENTLTASLEDYLEAIFHITAEKQAARPKDIAQRLNVKNASVTGALRALADRGLINYAPYDIVTLTQTGREAAEGVVGKHEALRDFFVNILRVDEKTADDAACRMEHSMSDVIFNRLSISPSSSRPVPERLAVGGGLWLPLRPRRPCAGL